MSIITYFWVYHYIKIAQKRCLNFSDIDELPSEYKAKYLLNKMKSLLYETHDRDKSLLFIIFSFIEPSVLFMLVLLVIIQWIAISLNIVYLYLILQFIDNNDSNTSMKQAYLYCIGLSIALFAKPLIENIRWEIIQIKCINVKTALTAMIIEKSLKISADKYDSSHIINLITDDIQKFEDFLMHLISAFGSIPLLICLIYFIFILDNFYILLGLPVLALLIPISALTAPLSAKYKKMMLQFADKRLKLIKELLISYLNIKMYCWEESIYSLIIKVRAKEINCLIKKGRITSSLLAITLSTDTLVLLVVSLSYFYGKGSLELSAIYPVLVLYASLKVCLIFHLPIAIHNYYDLKPSIGRIMQLLQTKESDAFICSRNGDYPMINIHNAYFYWPESEDMSIGTKLALSCINLQIERTGFYGAIGRVGSGKTALLLAMLNELELDSKQNQSVLSVHGKVGYCSQTPLIFNASIRENILFGNEYNEEWYKKVIYSCALDKDITTLKHSDQTIIGERGINLSEGQKKRINLARCIYDKANILLLDDILSSVDSIVSNHIVKHLLNNKTGLMKDALIILVTNQMNILPSMDKIIVMENGQIIQMDTYDKLDIFDLLLDTNIDNRSAVNNLAYDVFDIENEEKYHDNVDHYSPEIAMKQSVVTKETSNIGSVSFSVYLAILFPNIKSKCVQIFALLSILMLMLIAPLLQIASQYWLGIWATYPKEEQINTKYVIIYAILVANGILCEFIRIITIHQILFHGSLNIHNKMLCGVLYSSMKFYESNPVGRILNRFSQDQLNVDQKLPMAITMTVASFCSCIIMFGLSGLVNQWLYLLLLPIILLSIYIAKLYLAASRSLMRMEAVSKSPIYSYFTVCLSGLAIIRAHNKQNYVLQHIFNLMETNIAVSLICIGAKKWITFALDMCLSICSILVAFSCVYVSNNVSSAAAGITLAHFAIGTFIVAQGVKNLVLTENIMTSTERIVEYGNDNLKSERDELEINKNDLIIPETNWPKRGDIIFKNLSVSYRDYLDTVLKNINIEIFHGERIGIVGRTGCGKTTLFKSLFRFLKYHEGHIEIDGINICNISLNDLRKCFFIIPQNLVLFSSTLKYNLDPFDEYTENEIYEILNQLQLNTNSLSLESVISEYGSNLSVGECQLLCVARAMLNYKKKKILLIDEATSNIDQSTDNILQKIFEEKLFQNKTVLTIAHRINTVIKYDKILVLNEGKIIEFDTPQNLLQNNSTLFYKMYKRQQHDQYE